MINNSNVLVAHTKQAKWVNRVARNFCWSLFCGLVIFSVSGKLILAIRTHWFFSLRINFFAIFKKYPVPSLLAEVSHNEAKMRGKMRDLY